MAMALPVRPGASPRAHLNGEAVQAAAQAVVVESNGPDADARIDEAQALTDEQQARRAREEYREQGIPELAPDPTVAPHLESQERVLGARSEASVARIDEGTHGAVRDEGPIYVTSARLLHVGERVSSVSLYDIDELAMADDRILVTLTGGRGLMLDVTEPRQFRVLLAAARGAAAR